MHLHWWVCECLVTSRHTLFLLYTVFTWCGAHPDAGVNCDKYHAGLSSEKRKETHHKFLRDELQVPVCLSVCPSVHWLCVCLSVCLVSPPHTHTHTHTHTRIHSVLWQRWLLVWVLTSQISESLSTMEVGFVFPSLR